MALLEGLWREQGLTFVLVTHDSSIARRAPRLATIKAGQLTLTEQKQEQRQEPQPREQEEYAS